MVTDVALDTLPAETIFSDVALFTAGAFYFDETSHRMYISKAKKTAWMLPYPHI